MAIDQNAPGRRDNEQQNPNRQNPGQGGQRSDEDDYESPARE